MYWWDGCRMTAACLRFTDDYEREAIGTDWIVVSGDWSLVDVGGNKVLKEDGTAGAVIHPIISATDDDMAVGPWDPGETEFGLSVYWAGTPRIIVNYNPDTIITSWVDIHTGEVTTYKFYQNGVLLGEKSRVTTGWSDTWVEVRVSFGKRVDTDHLLTFSIWPTAPDGLEYCQTEGYYVCASYAAGQRYCALGNGGSDPVYFDGFSFGDYDIPERLCQACDCNCEWHCVPWTVVATFEKISNDNPDCDENDGLEVELTQSGEDTSGWLIDPECKCWWEHPDVIGFCEIEEHAAYDLKISLRRSENALTDFSLGMVLNEGLATERIEDIPLIVEESSCNPLKLVFGPLELVGFELPDCCTWNITITKAA